MSAVESPAHYRMPGLPLEAIDVIASALGPEGFRAYCIGNILKYQLRAGKKGNPMEDWRKAAQYESYLINGAPFQREIAAKVSAIAKQDSVPDVEAMQRSYDHLVALGMIPKE